MSTSDDQNFSPARGTCIRLAPGVPRSRKYSYEMFQLSFGVGAQRTLARIAAWSWALYLGPPWTKMLGLMAWNAPGAMPPAVAATIWLARDGSLGDW